jgi:hypothetical protein
LKQLGPIVAALLAAAALIWVVATTMPEDAPPPRETDDAEPADAFPSDEAEAIPQDEQAAHAEHAQPSNPAVVDDEAQPPEPAQAREERAPPLPQRSVPSLLEPRIEQFESEPRDSDAAEWEKHIAAFFDHDDVPPGVLDSVLCRKTICRVRMRWTSERAIGVMSASMRMFMGEGGTWPSDKLHPDPAIDVDPDADPNGVVIVDLYARRKTPEEAELARKQAAEARAKLEQMKADRAAQEEQNEQ